MTQSEQDPFDLMYKKRIQMTKSIVLVTILCIIVFGGVGYLLDNLLETTPILTIVLVILSFPVTQLLLYKRMRQLTKDLKKND